MRYAILASILLLVTCGACAQENQVATKSPAKQLSDLPGKKLYTQYCAACHGANAGGDGPAASMLKTPPADLTTLAKRHDGKFPQDYVSNVLRFGIGITAHGSSDMPTWARSSALSRTTTNSPCADTLRISATIAPLLQEKES